MMKRRLTALLLTLLMLFAAGAEAEESVTILQRDIFRVPFSNNARGFCIAYHESMPEAGASFSVEPTSAAVNRISGQSIGNQLKVLATQFPEFFLEEDNTKVQHHVWAFSDDFNGWRVDPDLIEKVNDLSASLTIPDRGYPYGDAGLVWDFSVMKEENGSSVFFTYRLLPGATPAPDTGDAAPLLAWSLMFSAALTGAVILKRKAKREA